MFLVQWLIALNFLNLKFISIRTTEYLLSSIWPLLCFLWCDENVFSCRFSLVRCGPAGASGGPLKRPAYLGAHRRLVLYHALRISYSIPCFVYWFQTWPVWSGLIDWCPRRWRWSASNGKLRPTAQYFAGLILVCNSITLGQTMDEVLNIPCSCR